ncbi:hypothetical protein MMEU_2051 [Mycobacterium marinum str. Europe]|nr:hypothetical protein MMEU_2051 [Mycobacterium marinum str. Europe]
MQFDTTPGPSAIAITRESTSHACTDQRWPKGFTTPPGVDVT